MVTISSTMKQLLPVYIILAFRNTAWMASVAGPVLPLYVRSLGVDIIDWGLMSTAMAVGLILFEGLFGSLSDRVNRKKMIILACIGMGLVFPFYGLIKEISLFFLYQLAIGAIAVAIGTTSRAIVADSTKPETRGTYMSLWWGFFTLGSIIGPVAGTYIADIFGYESAFYFSSFLLILGAIFFTMIGKVKEKKHVTVGNPIGIKEGLMTLIRIRNIRLALLLSLFMFTSFSSINAYFTIYASEELAITNVTIGWMLTFTGFIRLILIPLIGRLSDRIGQRILLIIGLTVGSLTLILFPLIQSQMHLWILQTILAIGFSTSSLNLAMISKDSPPNLSGMLMGLYGSSEDLGFIVGPLLYSFIWDTYGPGNIFIAAGVICGAGVLTLIFNK